MNNIIDKNSEILFLYDAVLTNPNGDPDDENRPRMDISARRNLVSDVRLKRYIRDYFSEIKEMDIFIKKPEGETVNSTKRLIQWYKENHEDAKDLADKEVQKKLAELAKSSPSELIKGVRNSWIDIRLFGATFTIRETEKGTGGEGISLTGALQFSWGYSLNPVEINPSASITSHFSSTGEEGHGAIGKDWRVLYSFIAFYGVISANWAKDKGGRQFGTGMTREDVKDLEESLIRAIQLIGTTRSKIGETPRLLLRIQYKDNMTLLGDLREYIELKTKDEKKDLREVRNVSEVVLNMEELSDLLTKNKDRIEKIRFWKHRHLFLEDWHPEGLKIENIDVEENSTEP